MFKKHLVKLVLIGDSAVGKTSLAQQFVAGSCETTEATTPADFVTKELEQDGRPVSLQMWDTPSENSKPKSEAQKKSFYEGAHGCALVYDITNAASLEALRQWKETFVAEAEIEKPETFPFLLIGNKVDLED